MNNIVVVTHDSGVGVLERFVSSRLVFGLIALQVYNHVPYHALQFLFMQYSIASAPFSKRELERSIQQYI